MNGMAAGETPTPESRKLALPPTRTVEHLKHYAEAHGIQMEIPSSTPD
jgi:hypothetical protein